ncbi:MAG: hypothetical protein QF451_17810, partial [Nitrospinota bacterium]|nr:hypothetical protein [Nitrospinota bacterium]
QQFHGERRVEVDYGDSFFPYVGGLWGGEFVLTGIDLGGGRGRIKIFRARVSFRLSKKLHRDRG